MSIFNSFYSDHYKEYHNYDDKLFNSDPMRSCYDKMPVGARILSLPVMVVWTGVKTALTPVVDLVCLVVFPVMAFKAHDKSYLWGCVNAIVDLAFWGAYIGLIVVVATQSFSGHMIVVNLVVSIGTTYASQTFLKKAYMGIRGPIHPEEDKGLMSVLFQDFKISDITNLVLNSDISKDDFKTGFLDELKSALPI